MESNKREQFFSFLKESIKKNELLKITLSNKRSKSDELNRVFVKAVELKKGSMLSFVYQYPTKDITKNLDIDEGLVLINEMIKTSFIQADLFTSSQNWHLKVNKKNGKIHILKKATSTTEGPSLSHDKVKERLISTVNNIYLTELGVATIEGKIKKNMHDKFRQINKYVEIVGGILASIKMPESFHIVDMGSGKGYLTFALYDYLHSQKQFNAKITGVEIREGLVESCNGIAKKAGFEKLNFVAGDIEKTSFSDMNMLIALHACDTATDDAIYKGITAGAEIIICAPCCHKQIRKEMNPVNEIKAITKHGILEERQVEIVTDAIRALVLEAYGYKTKVFEFISTEHTPKNVLITAEKKQGENTLNKEAREQINAIKKLYGIKSHYLEKIFSERP